MEDKNRFKNSIKYFIISGLILANALLLYGVSWTLKNSYYMNVSQITLWLTWIALVFIAMAVVTLVIESCKFIIAWIEKLHKLKNNS